MLLTNMQEDRKKRTEYLSRRTTRNNPEKVETRLWDTVPLQMLHPGEFVRQFTRNVLGGFEPSLDDEGYFVYKTTSPPYNDNGVWTIAAEPMTKFNEVEGTDG